MTADKTRLLVNIILDALCAGLSAFFAIDKFPLTVRKDYIAAVVFGLLALYFLYSLVSKTVYLIRSGRR